jgi:hypothetical protein
MQSVSPIDLNILRVFITYLFSASFFDSPITEVVDLRGRSDNGSEGGLLMVLVDELYIKHLAVVY